MERNEPKSTFVFKIPPVLHAALRERAAAEAMSMTEWLRRLVEAELKLAPPAADPNCDQCGKLWGAPFYKKENGRWIQACGAMHFRYAPTETIPRERAT